MNDSKSVFTSKIFWVNALTAAVAVLTVLIDQDIIKNNPKLVGSFVAVVAVLNVVLRLLTTVPVHVVALFLAFVLPLGVCQAACRHITPMPSAYPHDGKPVIVAMQSGFDGFWSDVPSIEYGEAIWECENAAGRCWSRGDRVLATFDRRRNLFAIRDVLPSVPVLFDRETGSKLL